MKRQPFTNDDDGGTSPPVRKLAVKPKEAAEMLSISERTLSDLASSKEIRAIKVGRAVIYYIRELERWLAVKSGHDVTCPYCGKQLSSGSEEPQ